jgi:hypothetical protein
MIPTYDDGRNDVELHARPATIIGVGSVPDVAVIGPVCVTVVVDGIVVVAHDPHAGVDFDERRRLDEDDGWTRFGVYTCPRASDAANVADGRHANQRERT